MNAVTQEERLAVIANLLERQQRITLDEICRHFGISRDSARRDLIRLTEQPRFQRIRGGARLLTPASEPLPFQQRPRNDAKVALARRTLEMLQPGASLYLDAGSTLLELARLLAAQPQPFALVSAALDALQLLSRNPALGLHALGGEFDALQRMMLGPETERQLGQFRLRHAVLGICALSEHGLSAPTASEAALKRRAIAQSEQLIAVGCADKFDTQQLHQVCELARLDLLICDALPDGPLRRALVDLEIPILTLEAPID
ncbi:Transcriptional regulatory protein, DeoR family [Azotobacter vinelandii CA]|uniref:Transcriptional regulatory protein, DeoR family n=2 Tax=Azotobacter vinelandii TaxID=354 RepID=C1DKF3_AZOVD|nr:DeoR/GlpR family DNA-binding transcription regulator [Azotobacter vinelandii]ACO76816.1 Transcriptional regulatory protein, DeoR family [Azotobacter vinelandii DJ]AGK17244.1 Transcriptional regulatory protein, DeoR family [Azotobacter vinelandii CA]AGK19389.1 Transcriptional regulatory protein, DeoR family [Azotobacter vinelandii CA6]SFX67336.1 transcriptional regulator, DeoR family [Azotobacter vinelandii]GLK60193.1 HTH-type transcriptional repressor GlcR [Azotobacter vinelandii]